MSPVGHIAAPDVCDGTSAVGGSRHRIPGASVGQPTEPCLGDATPSLTEAGIASLRPDLTLDGDRHIRMEFISEPDQ